MFVPGTFWGDLFLAVRAAGVDIVSPGTLTGVMFFTVVLYAVARLKRSPAKLAIGFMAGFIVSKIFSDLGIYDVGLSVAAFNWISDIVYFALALWFLFLGVVSFRDWRVFRKTLDDRKTFIRLSVVAQDVVPVGKIYFWEWGITGFLGLFLAFVQASWLQGSDAVQLVVRFAVVPYLTYLVFFLLPLCLVWWAAWSLVFYAQQFAQRDKALSKIYVVVSAVCVAYGSAILSYFR